MNSRFHQIFQRMDSIKRSTVKELFAAEEQLDDFVQICMVDGGEVKPLNRLSYGQRCVALLDLILLSDSDEPAIIDQPEDDLDNSYVFNHLTQTLKSSKNYRQLILVTHNPNIPIGGDAEQVFAMQSDSESAWVEACGSVDLIEISKLLLQILEGGRVAFEARRTNYGLAITSRSPNITSS